MVTGLMGLLMLTLPFAYVGLILWLTQGRKRDRLARQAEVQKEIIGKFTSGAELQAFLKSDEGRALFRDFGGPGVHRSRHPRIAAIDRILSGIILIVIGTGLAVLSHYADQPQIFSAAPFQTPASGPLLDIPPGMGLPAAVLLLAGIGMVISGLLKLYLKAWEADKS